MSPIGSTVENLIMFLISANKFFILAVFLDMYAAPQGVQSMSHSLFIIYSRDSLAFRSSSPSNGWQPISSFW